MDGQTEDKVNTDRTIAIIGAGAAGLSAAEALSDKGYTHITLYESADRVGGKCHTVQIDGKEYEYGAGVLSANNRVPLELAEKYNVKTQQAVFDKTVFVTAKGTEIEQDGFSQTTKKALTLLTKYRTLFSKHDIMTPGLLNVDPSLMRPFTVFAREHGFESLLPQISNFFTGFGYSYLDEVPAIYVLKYANWETINAFLRKKVFTVVDGIEHLWTAVAETHDVRLNSRIKNIVREEKVQITDQHGTEKYDAVILTSPLDELSSFMDTSKEEDELFSQIITVDYRTIACRLEDFPIKSGYIPEHFKKNNIGKPVFWYHRHHNQPIYTFYTIAEDSISDDTVVEHVRTLVSNMGGTIHTVHDVKRWKYFPHVNESSFADGFYEKTEQLQGVQNTYYAGEVMNFSCVGFTSEYSQSLIEKYF